ncbi:lysophospholipid acyltransferase family protein [Desulfosporosinus sp. BG]|uniref:lysophospholipid acyltransferase family protein n=1 Tax=Desulfosporosinus sp. BG TaxID=1633135 RepID=UPI00083A23D8|nr:lysophospholipid acyltransferase family protein [Desulfosporosinus sp. BG]ODA42868.1 1-acyl-sn-glycerol-3-phosphate acyltransferase [Desulfosporosinus sp. BG]
MFRTIVWFAYFWLYLIKIMPSYFKVNSLLEKQKINERDKLVNSVASKWAKDLLNFAGAKVTVIGAENVPLDRAVLFVSNHQGNFDIPILLGCIDKPKAFIAKAEILKIPIISKWMKQMNCLFLDRHDMRQSLRVMNQAADYLKKGYSMVIFPEGTRSKGNTMGEFKAGSLRIALKANVPIVPVTIKGSFKLMEESGFLIKPAEVEMVISEPIETYHLTKEQINGLHEKVRTIISSKL